MRKWIILCVLGCILGGTATFFELNRTYTYVSGTTYYPPKTTWQSASYAVEIIIHGEIDNKYSDFGNKHIFVKIYHNRSPILQNEYIIKAGDVDWKVHWKELSSIQIELLDSESRDVNKSIRTISFHIDPSTGRAEPK